MNAPTTAVQAIDEMHDLLRRLVTRPQLSGCHRDDGGKLRLVLPPSSRAGCMFSTWPPKTQLATAPNRSP